MKRYRVVFADGHDALVTAAGPLEAAITASRRHDHDRGTHVRVLRAVHHDPPCKEAS